MDAANEFDVAGAPGCVGPHGGHIFLDREAGRGIIPGEGQTDDAAGDGEIIESRHGFLGTLHQFEKVRARDLVGIVMDLKRANSGRDVDDARRLFAIKPGEQFVDTKSEIEIEHGFAVLDEKIAITGSPAKTTLGEMRRTTASSSFRGRKRTVSPARNCPTFQSSASAIYDGADKPAETGAIGTENNGHIASEIDCSDGIGVVMNVGRMQARFTAITTGPFRFGTDQAHARPAGIVMNLPGCLKQHPDVLFGEEIGGAVRVHG